MGVKGVVAVADVIRAMPTLNSITIDSTGNMRNMRKQKTYTLTANDETIDLSSKNIGSTDLALVAMWLQRPEVSVAVKVIIMSGCPLAGGTEEYGEWTNVDSDMTGFVAFCGVVGKVHEVNISDCGLGAASAGELAKAIGSADATLAEVVLDGCPLTGATPKHGDALTYGWENVDSQMEGFVALCAVLGKLKKISLANCGLGPASVAEFRSVAPTGCEVVW
jgi:hypothetical protein